MGLSDFFRGGASPLPSTFAGQVYGPLHALFLAAIPILLFWRTGEPLTKLGVTRFTLSDGVMAAVLFVVILATFYALRPLVASLRGRYMAVFRFHIRWLLPFWAVPIATFVEVFKEEIVDRGYVCARVLDLGWGKPAAVLISALVFRIPHFYYGWAPLIPIFVHGLIFALVFCSTRRIWPLVIAHSAYDLGLFALAYFR